MYKTVLSLSGGLDSTTVLAKLLHCGNEVIPVWFFYGSKHNEYERKAVLKVIEYYKKRYSKQILQLEFIDLSSFMGSLSSALLKNDTPIPEGAYDAPTMSQTVVPGRNIIFSSILAGIAWSRKADNIALGIHQGDHAIYPDCRPQFFIAMNDAIAWGTDKNVNMIAPFLGMDKAGIVKEGLTLKVPYELTRTCYKDQEHPCGVCGACNERLAAFASNNAVDPLYYHGETDAS